MLRDTRLMLEKAIIMGHSAEETNRHMKELAQDEGGNHIDMIQQKSKHGQQQSIINVDTAAGRRDILLYVIVA